MSGCLPVIWWKGQIRLVISHNVVVLQVGTRSTCQRTGCYQLLHGDEWFSKSKKWSRPLLTCSWNPSACLSQMVWNEKMYISSFHSHNWTIDNWDWLHRSKGIPDKKVPDTIRTRSLWRMDICSFLCWSAFRWLIAKKGRSTIVSLSRLEDTFRWWTG